MTTGDANEQRREIDPTASVAASAEIVASRLQIEAGVRIGEDVRLVGTEIRLRAGSEIRRGAQVTAIERLDLGAGSVLGPGLRASGRRLEFGAYFWSTNRVVIGGGGWQGPDSILTVGEATSFFDGAYVNLSEHVTIGSGCALSADTAILTHGCWQPVLDGYPFAFAPVVVEDDVVVYLKSAVMPGVTLHRGCTVAAGSVVIRDAPPFSLVGGVPARVVKADVRRALTADDRRQLVRATLRRYSATLEWKGVSVAAAAVDGSELACRLGDGTEQRIRLSTEPTLRVHVDGHRDGDATFDLETLTCSGAMTPLAEDLRDFLRRSGIKVVTERPFRPLPPAQLAVLEQLEHDRTP